MNYKCYCYSPIECTIEKTDEEEGEYYDDDGETYYVHTSFDAAKKMLITLISDSMVEWKESLEAVKNLKKTEI